MPFKNFWEPQNLYNASISKRRFWGTDKSARISIALVGNVGDDEYDDDDDLMIALWNSLFPLN